MSPNSPYESWATRPRSINFTIRLRLNLGHRLLLFTSTMNLESGPASPLFGINKMFNISGSQSIERASRHCHLFGLCCKKKFQRKTQNCSHQVTFFIYCFSFLSFISYCFKLLCFLSFFLSSFFFFTLILSYLILFFYILLLFFHSFFLSSSLHKLSKCVVYSTVYVTLETFHRILKEKLKIRDFERLFQGFLKEDLFYFSQK